MNSERTVPNLGSRREQKAACYSMPDGAEYGMTLTQPIPKARADRQASMRDKLMDIVIKRSLKVMDAPTIRLASGVMSRYYVDAKMTLACPEARELIGHLMLEELGEEIHSIDGIGGLELGAYPVAIAVSDLIYRERGLSIPVFIVRKSQKLHGMKKTIEGPVALGDKVLVVDDVITTGGSTGKAIEACKNMGLEVIRSIALIDRLEGRKEPVVQHGVKVEALLTLPELLESRE